MRGRSDRTAGWALWAAWLLCAVGIAEAIGIGVLDYLVRSRIQALNDAQPVGLVLGVSFSILGAVIVSRQPGNRIGWIYLLIGVLTPAQSLATLYYERGVIAGGLPGLRWSAWANNWATFPVFPTGLALFAFLLFPGGRLPSRRWRPLGWLAVVVMVGGVLLGALEPGQITAGLSGAPSTPNPLGVDALGGVASNSTLTGLYIAGMAIIAVVIGGLLLRGRRASPQEQAQVKLLAYAATVTIASLLVVSLVSLAGVSIGNTIWNMPIVIGFGVAVPVACGVAILRHGLYEIDRLISRTLSYALLTGVLLCVFTGCVLLSTRVLPFTSAAGVAASTLAAAALFNPLRVRFQRLVDRRFNRAAYDAQATAAAFGARLRDALDDDAISLELLHVVDRTLAPVHASVWIKPSA